MSINIHVPAIRPAVTQSVLEQRVTALQKAGIPAQMDKTTIPWGIEVPQGKKADAEAVLAKLNMAFSDVREVSAPRVTPEQNKAAALRQLHELQVPAVFQGDTVSVPPAMVDFAQTALRGLGFGYYVVGNGGFAAMGLTGGTAATTTWDNPAIGPFPIPDSVGNPARTNLADAIRVLGLAPGDRELMAALMQYEGPVSQTHAGDAALLAALAPYAATGKLQAAGIEFHEAPGGGFVVYTEQDAARAKALGVDVTVGSRFTM